MTWNNLQFVLFQLLGVAANDRRDDVGLRGARQSRRGAQPWRRQSQLRRTVGIQSDVGRQRRTSQ